MNRLEEALGHAAWWGGVLALCLAALTACGAPTELSQDQVDRGRQQCETLNTCSNSTLTK